MQLGLFVYTASMKRLTPLLLTIVIAGVAGFIVATNQKRTLATSLIASPSGIDQLRGISLIEHLSFDELQQILHPILTTDTVAASTAQQLLVKKAFQENRIEDLQNLSIDSDLYEAALWWHYENDIPKEIILDINLNPSPWIEKLLAWYPSVHRPATYPGLVELPVRDRDGSVVLSVLAIHEYGSQRIESLVKEWEQDLDLERQKAAALLCALRRLPQPSISTQNESLTTIQAIIKENDVQLAWRALHRSDGTIDPDVALAAMIVNQEQFMPILIESAKQNQWTHPEHAIIIAKTFSSEIANQIPFALLENKETRQKWWALFACGLLQEER